MKNYASDALVAISIILVIGIVCVLSVHIGHCGETTTSPPKIHTMLGEKTTAEAIFNKYDCPKAARVQQNETDWVCLDGESPYGIFFRDGVFAGVIYSYHDKSEYESEIKRLDLKLEQQGADPQWFEWGICYTIGVWTEKQMILWAYDRGGEACTH